ATQLSGPVCRGAAIERKSRMNGRELAQERKGAALKRKLRGLAGPRGVFFDGFLPHPVMVGSIILSSEFTIRRMLTPVKWDEGKVLVECGPGVGTVRRPVLARSLRDGELIVIDTNPLYIDYLKRTIRDSRFHAVLGSAENVEEIVRTHGH